MQSDLFTKVFIAFLFIIAKNWKQPNGLKNGKLIKLWCIQPCHRIAYIDPKLYYRTLFCYVKNQSRHVKVVKYIWIMRSILHNLYMLREKSRKDIYQNIDNSSFLVIRTQYSNFYFLNIFLIFHYNPVFILSRGRIVHACFLKV